MHADSTYSVANQTEYFQKTVLKHAEQRLRTKKRHTEIDLNEHESPPAHIAEIDEPHTTQESTLANRRVSYKSFVFCFENSFLSSKTNYRSTKMKRRS